jgi:DNA-binding NarL/FixJ family response regulator
MEKHRVALLEDDLENRERLTDLLTTSDAYELIGVYQTLQAARDALGRLTADIFLVDLGLPDGSGIDLIQQIRVQNLDTLSLVISGFHDEHRVFEALETGARGYILKHESDDAILAGLDSILKGGAPISPTIARLMLSRFQKPSVSEQALPEQLTERQLNILKLLSQGFTAREISEKLSISYYTVTTHIKNIYEKLQVNSRIEALIEAKKIGYL